MNNYHLLNGLVQFDHLYSSPELVHAEMRTDIDGKKLIYYPALKAHLNQEQRKSLDDWFSEVKELS